AVWPLAVWPLAVWPLAWRPLAWRPLAKRGGGAEFVPPSPSVGPVLRFLALVLASFAATEVAAYVLHRWVFHGALWRIHRTHHDPEHRHGRFEANDLFSLAFAALSASLMWSGRAEPLASAAFACGTGIALYGLLYFILHDLYAHRRFWPFTTKSPAAQAIKRAHGRHHQSLTREGQEPYGLFLFPPRFGRRMRRAREG
ncbi:MAG: sterol desaturase family protein, partial [Bacteroidota bacterium]